MSDLISRKEVIKRIEELPNSPNGYSATYDKASIIMAIEDVEPLHAHWIAEAVKDTYGDVLWIKQTCSRCEYLTYKKWNYCPVCGAKMDEVME